MLLEVRDLSIFIEGETPEPLEIVSGINLEVYERQVAGVIGESGSGKSMTTKAILGMLPPRAKIYSGSIEYKGMDLINMPPQERQKILGKEIGTIFQNPMTTLNPLIRVKDQIAEVIIQHNPDISDRRLEDKVRSLLLDVQLPPDAVMEKYPFELSGGQRQRVLIAIAVANSPSLLIADEATSSLDVTVQFHILKLLQKMTHDHKMAMILISHNLGLVRNIADYVYIFYAGEIMERGPVTEIFHSPHHPYTQGLIKSLPEFVNKDERVPVIPGKVLSISEKGEGCPFYDRCEYRQAACLGPVREVQINENHYYKCVLGDSHE